MTDKTIIYVKKPSDIPQQAHYAIFEFKSIRVPGYDRSDPDDTVESISYTAYLNQNDWEKAVAELTLRKHDHTSWQALLVGAKPQITTHVTVKVST